MIFMNMDANIEKVFACLDEQAMISWRRHLHQNPELSFAEYNTSQFIFDQMSRIPGLTVTRPVATSVMAVLQGARPGKTVAIRADMDALPIQELWEGDFRSRNDGVMHACGHDAHTAMLMALAKAFAAARDEISGTIKFIFQHAEEVIPGGGVDMVKAGVVDDVDYVFGYHAAYGLPAGKVATRTGPSYSAVDVFHLTLKGKGAHSSTPDIAIDPVIAGAELITALHHIVPRNVSAHDTAVLSVCSFHSGSASNVIPETATLSGTIRSYLPEIRDRMERRVREVVKGICSAYNILPELDYQRGYPAVITDPEATDILRRGAGAVLGEENVVETDPILGSEDFAYFAEKAKAGHMLVGIGDSDTHYSAHHPKFNIDEPGMTAGVKALIVTVIEALK